MHSMLFVIKKIKYVICKEIKVDIFIIYHFFSMYSFMSSWLKDLPVPPPPPGLKSGTVSVGLSPCYHHYGTPTWLATSHTVMSNQLSI